MIFGISLGSFLTNTIPAASIATFVPAPTAIPTSACVSAGASLIPSPTIATLFPLFCSSFTLSALCSGKTSAKYSSTPSSSDTHLATASASPVIIAICTPSFLSCAIASRDSSRIMSPSAIIPANESLVIT